MNYAAPGMVIDLRSDTVTRPTEGMRAAMARAEVGDDVYGEDPTVRALEERTAALLGKEAAIFVSSGTMGNQVAILVHTSRGDEVYTGEGSHSVWYESGAAGAFAGVQLVEVGKGGLFDGEELAAALKPRAYYCPSPRLCIVENTHNRGGGKVFDVARIGAVARAARAHDLALHLDGARLWNASTATRVAEADFAAPFDTVTVCFSKGLGAPVGSVLAGTKEAMVRARRFRKMLGGGMRQVGVLAAACLYALDHHRERLFRDHAIAARFAEIVGQSKRAQVEAPETNIVMVDIGEDAGRVAEDLGREGILLSAFGPRRLRVVTHLDVGMDEAERAARAVVDRLERVG